jgi:Tol biopolymer transport system component
VTSGNADGNWGVTWTQDGKLVYCTREADLMIMDANGSHQRSLAVDAPGTSAHPSTSPDGRYLFLDSWRPDAPGLVRLDVDTGHVRLLAAAPEFAMPHCSSDGKWVIYVTSDRTKPVWMITPDGGSKRPWSGKVTSLPVFSPDGGRVAGFYRASTTSPFEGGEPERTFELPPRLSDVVLRWTPDGRALTYAVGPSRNQNVWIQPLSGGAPRQLTDFKDEGTISSFDWAADGRLAVARGPNITHVVLITREAKK